MDGEGSGEISSSIATAVAKTAETAPIPSTSKPAGELHIEKQTPNPLMTLAKEAMAPSAIAEAPPAPPPAPEAEANSALEGMGAIVAPYIKATEAAVTPFAMEGQDNSKSSPATPLASPPKGEQHVVHEQIVVHKYEPEDPAPEKESASKPVPIPSETASITSGPEVVLAAQPAEKTPTGIGTIANGIKNALKGIPLIGK